MFQPMQLDVVTKVTSLVACNLRVGCPETLALFLHSAAHSVRGSRGDSCSPAQQTLRQLIRGLWKNQYCHRDSRKTFSIRFAFLILHFLSIFFCAKSNTIKNHNWAEAAFVLFRVIIMFFVRFCFCKYLHCYPCSRKN